jgi:AcrR family transcriptional regulator
MTRGDAPDKPVVVRPRIEGDREGEILDATVDLLSTVGYDRLTMDAVASAAKASKATLYRRWTSKAQLVVDALTRAKGAPNPDFVDTGSLREDLIALACHKGGLTDDKPVAILASVITALHSDQEFAAEFHERFLKPRIQPTREIFARAQQRGEIPPGVDIDLMTPVLPAVILHRAFIMRLPIDEATAIQIIDEIVVPAATGRPCSSFRKSSSPTTGTTIPTEGQ